MKTRTAFLIFSAAILLFGLCSAKEGFSQVTEAEKKLRTVNADTIFGWKTENNLNIALSQVSLTNWSAGGENSISINGRFNGIYGYKKEKLSWDNQVDLGYGLLKQGKTIWQKTDDRFELMSKLGYRISESLNGAVLADFKSQFAPGYSKPEGGVVISDIFAPAYFMGAMGIDYKKGENFSLFVSPVSTKMTLVLNDSLSDAGSFGVEPGSRFRAEFGGYVRMMWKYEPMKNVGLQTKVDLFSNYLKDPQYVDVNWEVLVMMKINKYLSVNINTLLIYDHDVNIGKDTNGDGTLNEFGPRIQFKELLGVGLSFSIH